VTSSDDKARPVSLSEVKNILNKFSKEREEIVASPHRERGEIVKAFVILAAGFEPSDELTKELQNHVKAETAPYKYPRSIEYVTELPKTTSGKIKRAELKRMEWEGRG
jgi:acyl-coenzyme A synthetase/AMP-(fatty) acid ligase